MTNLPQFALRDVVSGKSVWQFFTAAMTLHELLAGAVRQAILIILKRETCRRGPVLVRAFSVVS
jgi:hypothetical protein